MDKVEKLQIKAAIVDGHVIDKAQIEALSKVPPRVELIARLVGSLRSPIHRLHGAMKGHHRRLVYVLNAIHEKRAQPEPAA